jgi:hypothetical protein
MNTTNIPVAELVNQIELVNQKGCRFVSFTYTNKEEEQSRYVITMGFSYKALVEKSLAELQEKRKSMENESIEAIAADELIASFNKTLSGTQDAYTKENTYSDTGIKNLKFNEVDGTLHVFGLCQSKTVLVAGPEKKAVKSSEKTLAKNKIRKNLPVGQFVEFRLTPDRIHAVRVNGETVEFN